MCNKYVCVELGREGGREGGGKRRKREERNAEIQAVTVFLTAVKRALTESTIE